jgi:hypothetical protein
VSTD